MPRPNQVLTSLAATLVVAAFGASPTLGSTSPSPNDLAELASRLEQLRQEEGVAAVGFAITDREQTLLAQNFGWADLESKRPVTSATRFRVGSITKTFTGVGLLKLVEADQVALVAPVTDYLQPLPFTNPYRDVAPVRVAQLMEHTAGFTDISREEFAFNEPLTPLETVLSRFRDGHRTRWAPGLHSSYSNLGPGIAGRIMEIASGSAYESYMTDEVLQPLGMAASTWHLDKATAANLATGYNTDGETPIPYWHMAYRPFGALNTTPSDMARFIRMLLNDGATEFGTLLAPASVRRLETPATTLAARAGVRYGYGLGNYQWFRTGTKFHGHGGDGDGYLAHYGYAPEAGLGYFVVITAFKGRSLRRLRGELESFVTRHAPEAPSPPKPAPSAGLKQWVGEYTAVTARFGRPKATLTLRLVGEQLETRRGSSADWRPLVPVGPNQFRRPNEPEATVAILALPEGDIIYQGDAGNFAKRGSRPPVKSKEALDRDDY